MSRIGKAPIAIPQGTKVHVAEGRVRVEGPKGKLERALPPDVTVRVEGSTVKIERGNDERRGRSMHGLARQLVSNMVDGAAKGFTRVLEINGVLPAELLVTVEIRDLLSRRPPPFDLGDARAGRELFNQACSKCHGPEAVADPKGLAPVDLRLSIARFRCRAPYLKSMPSSSRNFLASSVHLKTNFSPVPFMIRF